jgi:hypothetical protein
MLEEYPRQAWFSSGWRIARAEASVSGIPVFGFRKVASLALLSGLADDIEIAGFDTVLYDREAI